MFIRVSKSFGVIIEANYSRMDQVKIMEDSIEKIFKKAVFNKFYLVHPWILCPNYTFLVLRHICFLRVGGWRTMFSQLYFNCRLRRDRHLNSWNDYQKLYIAIIWLSKNVQACIFSAEHEDWINMNENLLNRRMHYKIPKHALKD